MTTIKEYKNLTQNEVDLFKEKLIEISTTIHDNPELGLREFKSCELLISEIRSFGFQVESPVARMDTAFVATYGTEKPGPKIAFLAEYDALPELGHACGHNIIAASSFGAAIALRRIVSEIGGTVALYGTPDEEAVDVQSRGGKVLMAEAGLFDDVDAALMVHPTGGLNAVWRYTFPLKDFTVRFHGKPAHYTSPHKGINALESLLMFLNNINTLKRGWTPDVMFAYTITDGGGPSAITVPQSAEAHITMKAFYSEYLEELFERVRACAENVASMTGAKVEIHVLGEYRNMIPNLNLALSLYRNMKALGGEVEDPIASQRNLERLTYPGISTDFGNVSWLTPSIHGYCSIGKSDLVAHTKAFSDMAVSEVGHGAMVFSAKAMAMAAVDILADGDFARSMKVEFQGYQAEGFINVPGLPPRYPPFSEEFLSEF
jgi:amidohydrolase